MLPPMQITVCFHGTHIHHSLTTVIPHYPYHVSHAIPWSEYLNAARRFVVLAKTDACNRRAAAAATAWTWRGSEAKATAVGSLVSNLYVSGDVFIALFSRIYGRWGGWTSDLHYAWVSYGGNSTP